MERTPKGARIGSVYSYVLCSYVFCDYDFDFLGDFS